MIFEQAFGLLISKWRILLSPQDANFKNIHYLISACLLLHNICINNEGMYLEYSVGNIVDIL